MNPEYTLKSITYDTQEKPERRFNVLFRKGKRRECLTHGLEFTCASFLVVFLSFFATLFTHMSTYIISLHKPNIGDYVIDILLFYITFYVYIYVFHLYLYL